METDKDKKKKFKVTVIREDQYEIEFDETVFDEEFIQHFKKYFYDFDNLKDHAEHIAQFRARFGERFIDGYGLPLVNGKIPSTAHMNEDELKYVNHGLNINIISEDDLDCLEIEAEEVE